MSASGDAASYRGGARDAGLRGDDSSGLGAALAPATFVGPVPARIVRLEGWWVDGFGALRDVEIGGLSPRLTVLLGANEAGKSTHLTFLRYVLFGFPKRTTSLPQYEPTGGGRHGGRVLLLDGDERYDVQRYREDKAPRVLGPAGEEVGEPALAGSLGHADAGLFRSVFAFGLEELQSFSTLTEEGVRQHIFSAGVVGAGRSAREVGRQIGKQLDDLLKGARGRALINDLLRDIEALQGELVAATREAGAYGERLAEERAARTAADGLRAQVADERVARARLVALGGLWPRWHEAREAELALRRRPRLAEETVTDLRALAAGLGVRHERLRRRDEALDAAREADRAVSAGLGELGPGWTEGQVRAIDPSIVGRDEVRGWGARLSAAGTAEAEARRDETTAGQRIAELEAELEQRRRRMPETPPPSLSEIESRETLLAQLREERAELRAAEAAAAGRPAGSWLLPAAASTLLAVALALVGLTRAEGAGPWLAAAAIAAAAAIGLALGARGRAHAPSTGVEDLRERSAEHARRLGVSAAPTAVELGAVESRLRAERTACIGYEALRRELSDEEAAVRRATVELAQRRAAREQAAHELGEVQCEWRRFKTERGFPETLSTEGIVEWLAALDRCRDALGRRDAARTLAAEFDAEARQWEEAVREVLAAAGREAAGLDVAALEQALSETCAAADRAAELERLVAEADQELRARFAGDAEADAARRELADADPEVWAAGLRAADARIAELEARQEEAIREHENARRRREELERSADVPRLQAELESLRAELDEAVARYRELKLAQALVDRTLREFMRTRQPAVLATAGAALGRVTGGRYTAVVQSEGLDDLRVLGADGVAKTSGLLSRGTAEQLYLCLRLGLAREFAVRSVALPFVMDDCLVDFDPRRAAAAAGLLVEFAAANQVLVFTCHPETAALLSEAAGGEATVLEL